MLQIKFPPFRAKSVHPSVNLPIFARILALPQPAQIQGTSTANTMKPAPNVVFCPSATGRPSTRYLKCKRAMSRTNGPKKKPSLSYPYNSELYSPLEIKQPMIKSAHMSIEGQVTNFELSKKLKKLGVKQESLWYWWKAGHIFIEEGRYAGRQWEKLASAFTVVELGELTKGITESYFNTSLHKWACGRRDTEDHCPIFYEKTEADARGKMLIYLIEQGLIEHNVVDKRAKHHK